MVPGNTSSIRAGRAFAELFAFRGPQGKTDDSKLARGLGPGGRPDRQRGAAGGGAGPASFGLRLGTNCGRARPESLPEVRAQKREACARYQRQN